MEEQKERNNRSPLIKHVPAKDGHMKITEVKVFPVNEDRLKAYVSITIEGSFVVRDLKIIQGPSGLFVAMPSKKRKDGQFRDIAHPLNQETRAMIEDKVFEAYEKELKSMGAVLVDLKRQKAPTATYDDDH
jgi:stage V sporulation protein G